MAHTLAAPSHGSTTSLARALAGPPTREAQISQQAASIDRVARILAATLWLLRCCNLSCLRSDLGTNQHGKTFDDM
jgi:hypothetical protein